MFISASAMRRCAVELTGKNSVSPSTIPSSGGQEIVVQVSSRENFENRKTHYRTKLDARKGNPDLAMVLKVKIRHLKITAELWPNEMHPKNAPAHLVLEISNAKSEVSNLKSQI